MIEYCSYLQITRRIATFSWQMTAVLGITSNTQIQEIIYATR